MPSFLEEGAQRSWAEGVPLLQKERKAVIRPLLRPLYTVPPPPLREVASETLAGGWSIYLCKEVGRFAGRNVSPTSKDMNVRHNPSSFVDSPYVRTIPLDHEFSMQLRVTSAMTARFFGCTIHPVYATFALVEHGEYAARQAILPFLESEEDAVGASIEMEHIAATPVGWVVEIRARVTEIAGRSITCEIIASNKKGLIARGKQRQRVVSKEKLRQRIMALYEEPGPLNTNDIR
jgi:fluoroacetyl-CoA thioesterase